MKTIGTADLKAHLSAHLRDVRAGETITVLDRREPIARITPISDDSGKLGIRPAQGSLADIALPGPTRAGGDVLEDLSAERGERP